MTAIYSVIRFVYLIIAGKIRFPKEYNDKWIQMDDGLRFKIFRHMTRVLKGDTETGSIFIVRFRFKRLTHEANKKASSIPIPLIGGFTGFRDKIWMIDWDTGYWQGIYQWDDMYSIEKYKASLVLRIMNRRADESSLTYRVIPNTSLDKYLEKILVDKNKGDSNARAAAASGTNERASGSP